MDVLTHSQSEDTGSWNNYHLKSGGLGGSLYMVFNEFIEFFVFGI